MLTPRNILPTLLLIFATATAASQVSSPRIYPLASVADRLEGGGEGTSGGDPISVTLVHADGADLSSYDVAIVFGGVLYRGPFASPIRLSRSRAGVYQRPLQIYLIDSRGGQVHSWRNDTLYALGSESSVEIQLLARRTAGREFLMKSLERPSGGLGTLDVNSLAPIGGAFGDPHEGTNAFSMGDPHEGTNTFNRRGADGGAVNPGRTESEANQWYEQQQRTADSLQSILDDNPDNADAYKALGAANDSLGVHYSAIRAWQEAVRLSPGDASALVSLARAYDNYVRDSVPGQKSLRQLITDEPALGYAERDEQTTALDPLQDALKLDPSNAEGHALAGRIYRRLGDRSKALLHAKKGADLAPRNARYLIDLAAVYGDAGDNAKALDAASRALKLDPSNMRARRLLVGLLSRAGKHRDAVTAAMPIVSADTTDADAWLMVGLGHAALGKHADAIRPLRTAVRHARNPGEAYAALGASLLALGKKEEAAVAWQLAVEFRPDLAEMHYNSGIDALSAGDRKRAARELEILRLMDSSRALELQGRVEGR